MRAVLKAFPLPNKAGWRQAIRMTLAAILAYLATGIVGMQQGYWAVITCLVIVQGSLGATISAGIARVAGTAVGAVFGAAGVLLLSVVLRIPEWLVLLIVISPLSLLAVSRPIYRLAPLTGALVLLVAGSSNLTFALFRIAEIALGCVIGVLVSLFVLPERATSILIQRSAMILELLGDFLIIQMVGTDQQARELIILKVRSAFTQIQNDIKEVEDERRVHLLRSDPIPERLLRHLQRLRTDVNMVGRAAASYDGADMLAELANSIKLQFIADAETLRSGAITPPPLQWQKLILQVSPETPLGFTLEILQREFVALDQTLTEWTAKAG